MEENKKAAIEKIYLLTKQDAEFNEELRKKLGITSVANSAVIDDERLNQIYEYCIEDILRKQASNFYEPFSNNAIRNSLVNDYIRMERSRRKNDFGDYALALYQQIEIILNAIFCVSSFKETINKTWSDVFYKYYDKVKSKTVERTIGSIIFGTDTSEVKYLSEGIERANKDKSNARDKIRIVLFFFKYYANSKFDVENGAYTSGYNYNEYTQAFELLWDIYSCRNTNHRNPELGENEKVKAIMQASSYSYFKFNWALTEFAWLTKDYNRTIELIINNKPIEENAIITQLAGSIAFVKIAEDDQPTRVPDRLINKMKGMQIGDKIVVIVYEGNICNIRR